MLQLDANSDAKRGELWRTAADKAALKDVSNADFMYFSV
jgi:hypothetical protein